MNPISHGADWDFDLIERYDAKALGERDEQARNDEVPLDAAAERVQQDDRLAASGFDVAKCDTGRVEEAVAQHREARFLGFVSPAELTPCCRSPRRA